MTALAENLWLALAIGVAFGFVLERAGLGNAVKLAGQFYLRDLTVFKVMFTAIVTALVGLALLASVGAVDLGRIELPATFLLPQLVGGLVFGAGFVIGGYCPGTGCVGFASGRLDALMVVAGMVTGVYVFGEVFPLLAGFYSATPLGPVTLADLLQIRFGIASAMLAGFAVLTLVGAEWVERRFRPVERLGGP